jgi:hypothetical protein
MVANVAALDSGNGAVSAAGHLRRLAAAETAHV